VVCIDCGHNFETGRKMRKKSNIPDRVIDESASWLGISTRYRVFRGKRGQPCLQVSQMFLFFPVVSATYNLSESRAILTDFSAGDEEGPDVFWLESEGPGKMLE
jgi:hypothetical protein